MTMMMTLLMMVVVLLIAERWDNVPCENFIMRLAHTSVKKSNYTLCVVGGQRSDEKPPNTREWWLRSEQRRYGNDGANKFSHKVPEDNWRMAISSVETPLVSMLPKRLYLIIFPLHTHINGSEKPLVAHGDVYMTSAISKTLGCFPFVFFASRSLRLVDLLF